MELNQPLKKHKKDYPSGTALMLGKGISKKNKNKNFYLVY